MSVKINSKLRIDNLSRDELIRLVKKLLKDKEKSDKKISELDKELKKFKNAHTPSSQNKFEKVVSTGTRVGRKKGKKSNHKGRTRPKDKPTNFVNVIAEFNPTTGNKNIKETGETNDITITDFEFVKVVTQYTIHEYRDLDTRELFWSSHPDIPKKGIFGKNVEALAGYLRFEGRVVYEKITSIFTNVFDISMTTPTAMEICTRVVDKARPEYESLKQMIKNEKAVNGDETSAKRNGMPGWLWGFFH